MAEFDQISTLASSSASADDSTIISKSVACSFQAELNSGTFQKNKKPLTLEDKKIRIEALKITVVGLLCLAPVAHWMIRLQSLKNI